LNIWISGIDGIILHSKDGGETWETQASGTNYALMGISFPDKNNGWAVGPAGTILHTDNGGMSGIQDQQITSYDLSLKVNCYPVPFSGSTTFEFEQERTGPVEILILNQMGQTIDLITEVGIKGNNRISWNSGPLPLGIYFGRITSGKQVGIVKLVKW